MNFSAVWFSSGWVRMEKCQHGKVSEWKRKVLEQERVGMEQERFGMEKKSVRMDIKCQSEKYVVMECVREKNNVSSIVLAIWCFNKWECLISQNWKL